jgi:hypothetical protein
VFIGYSPAAYYRRCCCYRRKIIAAVVYTSDLFRIFIDSMTPAIAGNNDTGDTLIAGVDNLLPDDFQLCPVVFNIKGLGYNFHMTKSYYKTPRMNYLLAFLH